jgi:hypothetical protein
MSKRKAEPEIERLSWTIPRWSDAVGVCDNTARNLADRGEIEMIKIGRATRVVTPPQEFIERKTREARERRAVKDRAMRIPLPSSGPAAKRKRGRPPKFARPDASAPAAIHVVAPRP